MIVDVLGGEGVRSSIVINLKSEFAIANYSKPASKASTSSWLIASPGSCGPSKKSSSACAAFALLLAVLPFFFVFAVFFITDWVRRVSPSRTLICLTLLNKNSAPTVTMIFYENYKLLPSATAREGQVTQFR